MRQWVMGVIAVAAPAMAHAATPEVRYAPPPAWVLPPPSGTATATPEGVPLRVVYSDQQVKLGADADETYTAYRIKILTPEALAIGNVSLTWSPGAEQVTVHRLRILRDGQPTDVLAAQKFDVIQRENNLERSMLDGSRTATLQTPGLQVGDELEFAVTVRRRDPNLGDVSQGFAQLPFEGVLGTYRLRFVSPIARAVRWRATPDLPPPVVTTRAGEEERVYLLADPQTVIAPDGAPARFGVRRMVQYSTLADWGAVSRQMLPLFEDAAVLKPDSPVRAEIARIAGASTDPVARAEAALQLVEERIRYVYVGLDGANYRPARADETWTRRFGDCKAKTVLLIAILRGLGIAAEPVLVNASGGDGSDARLPTAVVFDHVLVRATAGGRAWWLDATRLGDRKLDTLPPPNFRWGLPLRAGATTLEPVAPEGPKLPQSVMALDIDATAGFDAPAKIKADQVLRGDEARAIRIQLGAMAPADADRAQAGFWRQQASWIEPGKTSWRYDAERDVLVLSMAGEGKPEWEGSAKAGRSLDIAGAGFSPPAEMKRPKEQDQAAPWATDFPRFRCWATTIRLPKPGLKRWTYRAAPVDRTLGGVAYWRTASLTDDVMRTVMSRRTLVPEIPATDAQKLNAALPGFDKAISRVFETDDRASAVPKAPATAAILATPIDWTSASAPCQAPTATP